MFFGKKRPSKTVKKAPAANLTAFGKTGPSTTKKKAPAANLTVFGKKGPSKARDFRRHVGNF